MTDHLSELAKYLRELKKESGFTLDELADELKSLGASTGASKQYLSMLMKGSIKKPSGQVLSDLAVALAALSEKFDDQAYWRRTGGYRETADIIATTPGVREAFIKILRERGLPAEAIEDVLTRVDSKTIARVVQGEEPLVIKYGGASGDEIASHQRRGYEVLALESDAMLNPSNPSPLSERNASKLGPLDYLRSARGEFGIRDHEPKDKQMESHRFPAGRGHIAVHGPISDQQRAAITAIAVAIEQLLEN